MFRFDESDPQFLVIYTGTAHAEIEDYYELVRRWLARLGGPRFGVVIVYEPQEQHDHDHTAEEESAYTRMLNDVRRDHRERINQGCLGYASVLDPVYQPPAGDEAAWAQARVETDRFSRYTLGLPGSTFPSIDEAKTWLRSLAEYPPIQLDPPHEVQAVATQQVGMFYGSTTGVTEYVAEQIAEAWQAAGMAPLPSVNIVDLDDPADLLAYNQLILGISTWNIGQLQDDWEVIFPRLDELDFSGKRVALFGIGDQEAYAENFIDAVGMLGVKLQERGATLAGKWPVAGYSHEASLAAQDDEFMGLAIDEINQHELTAERINRWVEQLAAEWALAG